ncbi:hypothetical protein IU482_29875 [Nocardia farcinica]|nr:hypothetical protein [Nocardia farcinica]
MLLVGEVVVPVDAEALAVKYLKAQFSGRGESATVATKVPAPAPARMVRVSLVNTPEQTPLHSYATLLVECWAPSTTAASGLARLAYGILRAVEGEDIDGHHVTEVVTVGGVASLPDETGPRYQFTLDLLLAGELI